MTTACLSDLHLGAWQLNDLLRYPYFINRLTSALEGVDEVVLLGDVLELRFQRMDEALRTARPFFTALGETLRRRSRVRRPARVVYVAGNHDHHFALQLIEREQEAAIERGDARQYRFSGQVRTWPQMFLLRALREMLGPQIEIEFAYSYARLEMQTGSALALHGHYLDLHLDSPGERLLALVQQALTAYQLDTLPPGFDLYEAVLRPQFELLYWIGQSPAGAQVQSDLWRRLRGDGRQVPRSVFGRVKRVAARRALRVAEALAGAAAHQLTERVLKGDVTLVSPARSADVEEGIAALMASLRALQPEVFALERWQAPPAHIIFGHTHRPGPLAGRDTPHRWHATWAGRQVELWNCGSWLYDSQRALTEEYYRTRWPGTFVLIPDGEPPRVVSLLKDLSPDELDEMLAAALPPAAGQVTGQT
jgi:UDP-2,3-diacylglucosamine pyrophosphatase LpxH